MCGGRLIVQKVWKNILNDSSAASSFLSSLFLTELALKTNCFRYLCHVRYFFSVACSGEWCASHRSSTLYNIHPIPPCAFPSPGSTPPPKKRKITFKHFFTLGFVGQAWIRLWASPVAPPSLPFKILRTPLLLSVNFAFRKYLRLNKIGTVKKIP